jgi:hypothetical protein
VEFTSTNFRQALLLRLRTCLPAGRDGADEISFLTLAILNPLFLIG